MVDFEFAVKCQHLFLRNIYTFNELKQMDIETEENTVKFFRLSEFYLLFEKALDDGDVSDEVRNFLVEDLDDCYPTLMELKDNIHHISLPKKKFCAKKTFSEKFLGFFIINDKIL